MSSTPSTVARRQKMYRLVSRVRLLCSRSSEILSDRTSDRRIQLSSPRRMITDASANRKDATGPHCIRNSPYPNAEVPTSRAKIQKTIMAVPALYRRPRGEPSASCNRPLAGRGRDRPRGQEEDQGHAEERDQVAGAVGLGEQPVDRRREQDPVAQPAQP